MSDATEGVDGSARIRRITPSGVVTTLAGAGPRGSTDGPGHLASFNSPRGLAVNSSGTVYVADTGNATIRAIAPSGVVSTLAGTAGARGTVDGIGADARFMQPVDLTVDAAGMIYVADAPLATGQEGTIRRVTPAGVVTTVTDSTGAAVSFSYTFSVAVDAGGTLYVGDVAFSSNPHPQHPPNIVSISPSGVVSHHAGPPSSSGVARFNSPNQVVAVGGGVLYIADTGNHTIRVATPRQRTLPEPFQSIQLPNPSDLGVTTLAGVAGAGGAADGAGAAARFNSPSGIAVDAGGAIYVADTGNHTIRKVTAAGVVTTLAGLAGSSGSVDGTGAAARFSSPSAVAVDTSGTVYVADTGNHAIRAITAAGVVTTLAGSPPSSGSADGIGAMARFFSPAGIAVDGSARVYVADTGNHTLRAITPAGAVTTIGGLAATRGSDDGVSSAARFNAPRGIAVDSVGTLYVADTGNSLIRQGVLGTAVAPTVTLQPVDRLASGGEVVQFRVSGTGNPAPGYQWQMLGGDQIWRDLSDQYSSELPTGSETAILTWPSGADGKFRAVLTNAAGSTTSNVATLTVRRISVSPFWLDFGGVASNGVLAFVTQAQRITVGYNGPEALNWTATTSAPWLQITPASGTGTGAFTVAVTPGAVFGDVPFLDGEIALSDSALGVRAALRVFLRISATGSSALPFGVFDTPVNGASGVSGSIAVTGWALDDIEVDRVEIWRDLVSGETTPPVNAPNHPGHGKVFIANALFVDGARLDVASRYGGYGYVGGMPLVSRAGWGCLLLTWGLWNQGNGPYTLYAFAFDREGNSTTLGTKTITVDNAHAIKPFGALDVPTYGETRSGSFLNFGWALTPNANTADLRSCTIANGNVFMGIDSGSLAPVTYGDSRTDVAGFFPGFSNGSSAGGHFLLDTTTLTNGVHQIGWYVVDSCGRADGIGSRFFTVLNGSSVTAASVVAPHVAQDFSPAAPAVAPHVSVRRTLGEWTEVSPNAAGVHVVAIEQSERIEVRLPALNDGTYTGAQVVNGESRALPLGSSLDAEAGIFYWQPAAGFLGSFDLEFSNLSDASNLATAPNLAIHLRIVVGPPMRMAIDTPAAGVIAQQPFVVAGWAIDLAATDGSGIDTVHVWAYPAAGGGGPIFLGVANVGDARPDVAAIYGAQFERSSYSLAAPPIAPGTYDIVVYPHRAATGTFDGAQVVRIAVR